MQICPYQYIMGIKNKVDLLLVPYIYVLNPSIKNKIKLNLENSIVIFDEAHNIECSAEEACSYMLSYHDL